jgi:nucleoside-diphosphate-sugar epimerase
MHIIIFGASRGVGRAAVAAAIAAGHTVTAFARNTESLTTSEAAVVAGDVLDRVAVERALTGDGAVIVALGVRPGEGAKTPEDVCSRGTRTIVEAMRAAALRRIVVVSSYGVGPTRDRLPFVFGLVAKTLLKGIMADKERQEQDVRDSGLDWTIVQPMGLTDDPATNQPYVSIDGSRRSNRVARADVAAVCIDAIARNAYLGESISVSGAG